MTRMTPSEAFVETMALGFEGGGSSGALVYAWENTTFRIPISR